jgi:hypothetical protein
MDEPSRRSLALPTPLFLPGVMVVVGMSEHEEDRSRFECDDLEVGTDEVDEEREETIGGGVGGEEEDE